MNPIVSIVSPDPGHHKRLQRLAQNLLSEALIFQNEDEASERETQIAASSLVFVSGVDLAKESDLAGRVQVVKYSAPDAWVIVVANKQLKTEAAQFLKKSGAYSVLLEDEFVGSSKPEFIGSQKMHGQWIALKAGDLRTGVALPASLFHFMPLNHKFVPFMSAGAILDAGRKEKAMKVGEVFYKREDIMAVTDYVKKNEDLSAAGLLSRCRQQFIAMNLVYKDLVLVLTDQSEAASFKEGKALLERCEGLADDFITSLASVGDAWAVVNNTGFDDLSPIDRAPAVASIAGLMSLMSGIGNATTIFLSALLADVGLLDLPPENLIYWKEGRLGDLPADQVAAYQAHPIGSLNRILSRKIPLSDEIREIVMNSHERHDMKGFPAKPLAENIPQTAMLIQLAEMLDNAMKVDFGRGRRDPIEVRDEVLEREKNSLGAFPYGFLDAVGKAMR